MKLLKKLLAIMIALSCVFAITACDNDEETELDTTKHGWALEYEIEEDDDASYVVITGLFLSDGEKYEISEEDYDTIDLVIGAEGKITVPVYDEDGKPNAMNAAWGGMADYDKIFVCMSSHKTTENIEITKEFSVSIGDPAISRPTG